MGWMSVAVLFVCTSMHYVRIGRIPSDQDARNIRNKGIPRVAVGTPRITYAPSPNSLGQRGKTVHENLDKNAVFRGIIALMTTNAMVNPMFMATGITTISVGLLILSQTQGTELQESALPVRPFACENEMMYKTRSSKLTC